MDQPDQLTPATVDEIRHAFEALTECDLLRLDRAAKAVMAGTEYSDPADLVNEAMMRTLRAARGEKGRVWPTSVPFMAYLIQTMKGLADDSLNSHYTKLTDCIETFGTEALSPEEALGARGHAEPDVVTLAIEVGESVEASDQAIRDLKKIDEHFADDEQVGWILMGHKDGLRPAEICELAGMNLTQYGTARRRFRRGVERLFPGRSKK